MNPGVYGNLSNADYHGGDGASKSMLDIIAQSSPLHLHHIRTAANDNVRVPTPAQLLGTAFHSLLLEPGEFYKDYCLSLRQSDVPDAIHERDVLVSMVAELNATRLPKLSTSGSKGELVARIMANAEGYDATQLDGFKLADLKTELDGINATRTGLLSDKGNMIELAALLRENGKDITLWSEVKATWLENNGQRIILDADAWAQLHNMRDAVMAHPAANKLLTAVPGKAEQSVYWIDPVTGELCRCRPDFWRDDGVIVDVKTTLDASPEGFAKSVAGWRYHVQHPFYQDGVNTMRKQVLEASAGEEFPPQVPKEIRAFLFLAVEKTACVVDGKAMGVAVYSLDAESVKLGRAEYRRDLNVYASCSASGEWPGYGDKIQSLTLPAWSFNKNAALLDNAA